MSQLALLEGSGPRWECFDLPDAEVRLLHGFLSHAEADTLFRALRSSVPWRQDKIRFYGKEHLLPRLQQWYGDPGLTYTWSRIRMTPEEWTPTLFDAKRRVEEAAGGRFNTVLLNLYRTGDDTVAWHTDDERELGKTPLIASVSLGAQRDFVLRHNTRDDVGDVTIPLPTGSLLLMGGTTQSSWQHALPRRKRVSGERINLTFRCVLPSSPPPRLKK